MREVAHDGSVKTHKFEDPSGSHSSLCTKPQGHQSAALAPPPGGVPHSKAPPRGGVPIKAPPPGGVPISSPPHGGNKLLDPQINSTNHVQASASCSMDSANPSMPSPVTLDFETISKTTMSYPKWCAELVSHVLRSRTSFGAFVSKSIQLSRHARTGKAAPSFFPVPIPTMGLFDRKSQGSSVDCQHTRHLSKAVHVMVMGLNFWYAGGKHGDMELLRREPSRHHLILYQRIRLLIKTEGPATIEQMPKAGRRFTQLTARLGELSQTLTRLGASANPYDKSFAGFAAPKDDTKDERLTPYHDLDASKIKLHGKGEWDATPYLSDGLLMAYREPKVLLHHMPISNATHSRDQPSALAALAQKWDSLGLLYIHRRPIHPDSPVRIFGAFKDSHTHRQIGDKRGQNALESKVVGPSVDLPSGCDLAEIYCCPKTSKILLSITDRKDFYHQPKITQSKAITNTIAPAVPKELVENTNAYASYLIRDSKKKYDRSREGDRLGSFVEDDLQLTPPDGCVWTSFNSILQGDHAGVEIATEAHTQLLQEHGLLDRASQVKASRPLRSNRSAQGLVIDDFFTIGVERHEVKLEDSKAFQAYKMAQEAYGKHALMGSPQKDLVAVQEGKVIGAQINSSDRALKNGVITLAAPPEKRRGLSHLTLLLCSLGYTTDSLHLCLVGGWVSALGYRRPMMALLNQVFHMVPIQDFDRDNPKIMHLPRKVAEELVLISVLMPLMTTELSAPFSRTVYCTDASISRGAVLEAEIDGRIAEILWKVSRSKGAYSRMLSPSEALLKRFDAIEETGEEPKTCIPNRPLAYSFEFLELFSGASKITKYASALGIPCGPPLDLDASPEFDLSQARVLEWITWLIAERKLLGIFMGPPCTTFSIMRRPRLRSAQVPYGFDTSDPQTLMGNTLALRSCQIMHVSYQHDTAGIIETPHSSYMKGMPPWKALKKKPLTDEVRCDSCRFGSCHRKSFRFLGLRTDMSPLAKKCCCVEKHVQVQGVFTKGSATYTDDLAKTIAEVLCAAIRGIKDQLEETLSLETRGLECQLSNEVMNTARWKVAASWAFRKQSHINILEEASLLKLCNSIARQGSPIRISVFVDSNVIRCATSKGRTSSLGLGPVLRRVTALCVAAGIYISIPFSPTRLNCESSGNPNKVLGSTPGVPMKSLTLRPFQRPDDGPLTGFASC